MVVEDKERKKQNLACSWYCARFTFLWHIWCARCEMYFSHVEYFKSMQLLETISYMLIWKGIKPNNFSEIMHEEEHVLHRSLPTSLTLLEHRTYCSTLSVFDTNFRWRMCHMSWRGWWELVKMLRWHGVECAVGKQSRLNRCYDLDTNTRRTPILHTAFSVTNSIV